MSRPKFVDVPCRKTLGHGESCQEDYLCGSCEWILILEQKVKDLEEENDHLYESLAGEDI